MSFRAPAFWYDEARAPSPALNALLRGASALYRAGYEIHQRSGNKVSAAVPVICVGGLNVGGSGKTPACLALMDLIKRQDLAKNVFFLSRGYGGSETGPLRVDISKHNFWQTGDEPLLLAAHAPTIIARDRLAGARFAKREGADAVLMDDGLQNPHILKDLNFIVVDGAMGFGNGMLLPAGPLREPLEKGLDRADAFILIGDDRRGVSDLLPLAKPLFRARIEQRSPLLPTDHKYVAFAGTGHPQKFFDALETAGYEVARAVPFPDHYPYEEKDITDLKNKAASAGASLVTTEKDQLRIPESARGDIQDFKITLRFEDEPALASFMRGCLRKGSA